VTESPPPQLPEKSRIWSHPLLRVSLAIVPLVGAWLLINRPPHDRPVTVILSTPAPSPGATPSPDATRDHEASLELLPIIREEEPDDNSARHLLLHIPIKTRTPKTNIDVKDLVVHVLFYDLVDKQSVAPTAATVNSHWVTPPADWRDTDTEELAVDYQLPKSTPGSTTNSEHREYFGYVVRIYYKQQLQAADAQPERLAKLYPAPATLPGESSTGTSARPSVPPLTETTGTPVAVDGIAAGATLGLLPVTSEEKPDENSARRFLLHIPIKARPGAHIAVKDLVIHVLFYDLIDGKTVAETAANVNSKWTKPPPTWANSTTEELAVEYQLPKPKPGGTPPHENRKYYGYIVRLYYQNQFQAAIAQPQLLAQKNPPPAHLSPTSTPAEPHVTATPTPVAAPAPVAHP